jgi:membrane protease YdiL (CAAX protease family)
MALSGVNSLPLSWMAYDTAIPPQLHVATAVFSAVATLVAGTFFLALVFMAGEGMMRLGFPDHIQQWKMWSPGVANSTPALGRTVAPYLILGIELGFVVAFYLVTSRFLGWWSPASALAEPDFLATYLPWLTAVSTSLFAAFSEEITFRAIPIGAAAILGRRYGRPGLWIWSAVIVQALVFGAAHANYPQQPAFARVVEIFPTYLAWGAICVYFGLIPSIIGHFTYDLVFFSLPLFAAETTGIWFDRFMVIAAGTLPLAIVFVVRWRKGAVSAAPDWALNRNWSPPARSAPAATPPEARAVPAARRALSFRGMTAVAAAALLGLALWGTGLDTEGSPHLTLTRHEAEAEARSTLEARGVRLGPEWIPLFSISAERDLAHQFVWREGSEEEYLALVGNFLNSPAWRVRFVSFDVPPEERAESYTLSSLASGQAPRVGHALPEGRPGETLTEEEARTLALRALEDPLGTAPEAVREISADETVRPNRTDWTFTFAATEGYPLAKGEGRAEVQIAGNEVVGVSKYVHVPEDWEREWRAQERKRSFAIIPSASILLILAAGALVLAVLRWSRGSLHSSPVRILSGVMATLLLLTAVNEWPATVSAFTTQLSFGNQVGISLLGLVLGLGLMAVGVSLLAALGHTWIQGQTPSVKSPALVGLSLGVGYVGLSVLLSRLGPDGPPGWPGYGGAVSYLPWMSAALGAVIAFLTATAMALLLLATLERLAGTRWSWTRAPLVLLVGLTLASNPPGASWMIWVGGALGIAVGIGLLWTLCRRVGWAVLPGVVAAPVLLGVVETALRHPFPGHTLGAVLALAGVAGAMHLWTRAL